MNTELFRKSIYFTPSRWLDMQAVMADLNSSSPSLAIEQLITNYLLNNNKKGAVNAQPRNHSSR